VRDDTGAMLMTVSEQGRVGIGDYETRHPQAHLEVQGGGDVMTLETFDGRTLDVICGQSVDVPFTETAVMGHYGVQADVDASIDKSIATGQIQSNRAVIGRVSSRQQEQLAAVGHLGTYAVVLEGLLPNPPDYIYQVTGVRGVVDADEVATDFTSASDGYAAAVMAQVEDNSQSYPHIFALYATGAKSSLIGSVGINTTTPQYDLDVDGDLRVTGTIYADSGPQPVPDYVFEDDYSPLSLTEIESYIETEKHLPWIHGATADTDQIDLTSLNLELLETVENLQLQILDLNKKLERFESQLNN
jgi:hypothetical protein